MITPDCIYSLPNKEVSMPEINQRVWCYNPLIFGSAYQIITIDSKPPQYFIGGYGPFTNIP